MYEVIYDPERQIAALIDPDGPRGLGPIVPGPDGPATLEAFVAMLERDPATLTPWAMEDEWRGFIAAVAAGLGERTAEAPESGQEPASPPLDGEYDTRPGPDHNLPQEPAERPELDQASSAPNWTPPAEPPPRCANCQATSFTEQPGGTVACSVCGEPLPDEEAGRWAALNAG